MPKASGLNRTDRVGQQLHREIAQLLSREYGDPRIKALTVSDVQVARDLRNAKVFLTVASGQDVADCLRAVHRASGDIRTKVGARMRLRHVPALRFEHDTSLDSAFNIEQLIQVGLPPEDPGNE